MIAFRSLILALAVLTLLAACATTQAPAPVEDRSQAGHRSPVEEVRASAPEEAGGLQVFPLRNPAVDELIRGAEQAESVGDLDRAAVLLERAIRIEPRDPELLQNMAEIRLAQSDWEQAEAQASRSFDVGPRVGELCQRNWRTIALARERTGRHEDAHRARERLQACRVEPPPRF
ncbi:MAG: tetratricopeptide repeat protein [Wenzhouxiangella sp.]|nr:tetratricopeptide repeat protein [Wenzhouxiangella sp.]MCH8478682.1 tetratricopeptide repeat protein [Wenzhouxiangella sp.]